MASIFRLCPYAFRFSTLVEEFELVKETDHFVTYIDPNWKEPRRERKEGAFFHTRAEALEFHRNKLMGKIDWAKQAVDAATRTLERFDNDVAAGTAKE